MSLTLISIGWAHGVYACMCVCMSCAATMIMMMKRRRAIEITFCMCDTRDILIDLEGIFGVKNELEGKLRQFSIKKFSHRDQCNRLRKASIKLFVSY